MYMKSFFKKNGCYLLLFFLYFIILNYYLYFPPLCGLLTHTHHRTQQFIEFFHVLFWESPLEVFPPRRFAC